MNKETMNIHKALCELKILDDRIPKIIRESMFITTKKSASKLVGNQSVEDFATSVRSNYDKISDLIRRREAIKRAVVLSNAVTRVTVGGAEYTVAEAIELKNHGLDGKKYLRAALSNQITVAESNCETLNQEAERKADLHVQGLPVVRKSNPRKSRQSVMVIWPVSLWKWLILFLVEPRIC